MVAKKSGLSHELIIHPGETLYDILRDRKISQSELAKRTGVTEPHISKIVNGEKDISSSFAKKLEYALSIDASFWINLQANYDYEKAELEEENSITPYEFEILDQIKDVIKHIQKLGFIKSTRNKLCQVFEARKFFCISNLSNIDSFAINGVFRKAQSTTINIYVLYAWIKLCNTLNSNINVSSTLNIQTLKDSIPQIKSIMFSNTEDMQSELEEIFSNCGIAFNIVRHFKGAPVHGYINTNENGSLGLSLTIRYAYADIFWFTLFHEIGHILNGDVGKKGFIDYTSRFDDAEKQADLFARDTLISPIMYKKFISREDFSLESINNFAESQNIMNYIVIGRLQKEKYIDYSQYSKEKIKYKWVEN